MSLTFTPPGSGASLRRVALQRYAVAVMCVSAAALLRGALVPALGHGVAEFVLLIGMLVAGWYGGPGPVLVATLLGAPLGEFVSLGPWGTLEVSRNPDVVHLLAFVLAGTVAALMVRSYHRKLERAADEAEQYARAEREQRLTAASLQRARVAAVSAEQEARSAKEAMESRLQRSEERLALAAGAARFVVFDWHLAARQVHFVGEFDQIGALQWTSIRSWARSVHREDRRKVLGHVRNCLRFGTSPDIEFRITRKDGSTGWIAAKAHLMAASEDGSRRMVGVLQDITQEKLSQQALIRSEKLAAAGRLAAAVAHEVNNPLAAVTNLLFIINNDSTLSEAGRQYARLAQQELNRASEIAKQALGFYRESSRPEVVDVAELLDEVLLLYARNVSAQIKLSREVIPGLRVYANKGELKQVFSNLISNAVHALKAGGVLHVRAEASQHPPQGEGVLVQIRDNGPGISREHLNRMFEPFFTTREGTGTGLGLWVVDEIVRKYGGTVQVETSTDPSAHGTCFNVFLPAGAVPSEQPPAPEEYSRATPV